MLFRSVSQSRYMPLSYVFNNSPPRFWNLADIMLYVNSCAPVSFAFTTSAVFPAVCRIKSLRSSMMVNGNCVRLILLAGNSVSKAVCVIDTEMIVAPVVLILSSVIVDDDPLDVSWRSVVVVVVPFSEIETITFCQNAAHPLLGTEIVPLLVTAITFPAEFRLTFPNFVVPVS